MSTPASAQPGAVRRWLGASRWRLAGATVVMAALAVGGSLGVADYIRHRSASPRLDIALITAAMFLLLGAAVFGALLAGDLLWGKPWRRRWFGAFPHPGAQGEGGDDDKDWLEEVARRMRGGEVVRLSVLTVLLTLGGVAGIEALTGGFFEEYGRIGVYRTSLRGARDADQKRAILLDMADAATPVLEDYTRDIFAPLALGDDPDARLAALDALFVVGHRMNLSVDLLRHEEGTAQNRWELRLANLLRDDVAPKLAARLAGAPPEEQARILRALGAFRWPRIVETAKAVLASHPDENTARAAILALGRARLLDGLPVLTQIVRDEDAPAARVEWALWSIGEIIGYWVPSDPESKPPQAVQRAVDAVLERAQSGVHSVQCAAVDALRKIRDARAADVLFRVFEDPASTWKCPRIEVEQPASPPLQITVPEKIRIRVLRAIAYIAKGNPKVEEWVALQKQRSDAYPRDVLDELAHIHAMVRTDE